jgi:catechol 2,3-dioxygenase-like lactoylglutathione lyase family enzyme
MLGNNDLVTFVPTLDYAKARAFYEGVLGLRFVSQDGFAMVMDANGIQLRIVKLNEWKPLPITILGWEVSNISKIVAAMTSRGVTFEVFGFFKQDDLGIWTTPNGDKVAWFKDPDGNTLSLSEHV